MTVQPARRKSSAKSIRPGAGRAARLRPGAVKLEQLYFDSRKNRFPAGGLMVMLLVPLAVFTVPP